MITLELIMLVTAIIFTLGVLVGVRCQEINLRGRERQLIEERRRLNEKITLTEARFLDLPRRGVAEFDSTVVDTDFGSHSVELGDTRVARHVQ